MACFGSYTLGSDFISNVIYGVFCISGSLLVSAAHFGAYTLGSDISSNVIHGRGKTSRSTKKNKWRGKIQ